MINKLAYIKFILQVRSHNLLSLLVKIFNSLFIYQVSNRRHRSWLHSFLLTLFTVSVGIGINWQGVKIQSEPFPPDQHARISLELAVNRAKCGKLSHFASVTESNTIRDFILDNREIINHRVLSLPELLDEETTDYCERVNTPIMNNENSLMFMETALLRLFPDITVSGLGFGLSCIRVTCLAVFVFFLLRTGANIILAFIIFINALIVVCGLNSIRYYSLYPFLIPFTFILIALFGLCLCLGFYRRIWSTIISSFIIGIFGAFFCNLRTSYLPVILTCLLIYALFANMSLKHTFFIPSSRRRIILAVIILSFFTGFKGFNVLFIRPLVPPGNTFNYHNHPIAHPLVLFLAVPQNDFSDRMGIIPADAHGLDLAREIDNEVNYLGPNYEKALYVYYFKLWFYYPQEMLNLYKNKLKVAGHSAANSLVFFNLSANSFKNFLREAAVIILMPVRLLQNGAFLLFFFLSVAIFGLFSYRFFNMGTAFALTSFAFTSTLLQIESAITASAFGPTYHQCLFFCIFLFGVLIYQAGINILIIRIRRFFPVKLNEAKTFNPGLSLEA